MSILFNFIIVFLLYFTTTIYASFFWYRALSIVISGGYPRVDGEIKNAESQPTDATTNDAPTGFNPIIKINVFIVPNVLGCLFILCKMSVFID